MSLSSALTQALYDQYMIGNYGRVPINIVRGEGSYLWDAEGKKYLDLLPGLGVNGLGHCPPRVVKALQEQAGKLLHIHNNYLMDGQARLAQGLISKLTGMDGAKAFFCNSGTESSEAALKIARLWGKENGPGCGPNGKWKVITLLEGFHGRSYGALSATGQTKLHKGCEPLLPGFIYTPLNDIDALAKAFQANPDVASFWAEPVQGEGGINICKKEFLVAAKELCVKHGALLGYDEVQCGLGRTGDYYAYQSLGAPAPDVLWLAKALGGGFPIGATIARAEVAQYLKPGTHGTTFGGNPLATAAGLAVLETIAEEKLLENVKQRGAQLGKGLEALQSRFPAQVKEIRRLGLMAALELVNPAKPVLDKCREKGLLINVTHDTVLRFLPAINVSAAQIEEGLAILGQALAEA